MFCEFVVGTKKFTSSCFTVALATSLGLACGDDGSSSGTTSAGSESQTTTTSETTTSETTTSTGSTGSTGEDEPLLSCPDVPESKCGYIDTFVEESWSGDDYSETMRCILETLRDVSNDPEGTTSTYIYIVHDYGDFKDFKDYITLGDGSMLRQTGGYSNNGQGTSYDPVEVCTMRPSSWYQDCLETPDEACTSDWDWVESCVEMPEYTCPSV